MSQEWYDDQPIVCQNCDRDYTWYGSVIKRMDGIVPDVCKFCLEHPNLHPIELICQNASHPSCQFIWSTRDQDFYAKQRFQSPELCKPCRDQKKAQQAVRIKCITCEIDYTYNRNYVISYRRKEGEFDGRDVCKLCFKDPERAERIKKKREKKEKAKKQSKQKIPFQDTVGYYLLTQGTKADQQKWQGIIDNTTYDVPSNVQSYEVPDEADWYDNRRDRIHNMTLLEHILNGSDGSGHDWPMSDPESIVVTAASIALSTEGGPVIQCTQNRPGYVKYNDHLGIVVIIRDNEYVPPDHRILTGWQMEQSDVAKRIRGNVAEMLKWKLA